MLHEYFRGAALKLKLYQIPTRAFICLVLFITFTTPVMADIDSNTRFNKLADEFFDSYFFPFNPSLATQLGVHDYDAQLKDYSKAGIDKRIAILKQFEQRVMAINPEQLDEQTQGDRELVLNYCRSTLLTLETIRPWEKNPGYYTSEITRSALVTMQRPFAPVNERLRTFIAREKLIPAVLENARQNLKNPPRTSTEVAIEHLPGIIKFFENDVPAAFVTADDPVLIQALANSNANTLIALRAYQSWLKNTLLERSNGDFRIGADVFVKKLQYDEMVDTPLDELLAMGYSDLRKNQKAYERAKVQVADDRVEKRSQPELLLNAFSNSLDGLITFIKDKHIITIPSDIRPIMQETPPYIRATSSASMNTPGAFENNTNDAYFNVTLPQANWTDEKKLSHMQDINHASISITSIHEAYPGHYVQSLWMHTINNRVRQILGSKTNSEGWAHYCEQMMLDEGYGESSDGHEASALRLGQLRKALLRNARYIVGIKMHTSNMSIDEAVDFFVNESYQSLATSKREVKRATSDPTYLYYTLGKLQILTLRAELQQKQGDAFNLQQFHDDFMRQGRAPIKIVRRALLNLASKK